MLATEIFFHLSPVENTELGNSSQELHAALVRFIGENMRVEKGRNLGKKGLFCLSPIMTPGGQIPRRFTKGKSFLFRVTGLDEELMDFLASSLPGTQLDLKESSFTVKGVNKWAIPVEEITPCRDISLFFLTPTAFRTASRGDLPLPCPDSMENAFARYCDKTGEKPDDIKVVIKELHGDTLPLYFSKYMLIGFAGIIDVSVQNKMKAPLLAHFLGMGHATDRGMGNVISMDLPAPHEIKQIWKELRYGDKKRLTSLPKRRSQLRR